MNNYSKIYWCVRSNIIQNYIYISLSLFSFFILIYYMILSFICFYEIDIRFEYLDKSIKELKENK